MSLKLKLNTKSNPPPPGSTPSTPLATPGGTKLKFKIGPKSAVSSPAHIPLSQSLYESSKTKTTKAGRTSKPTAKIIQQKRSIKEEPDSDDEGTKFDIESTDTINVARPHKKLKLSIGNPSTVGPTSAAPKTPGTVILKTKLKGRLPPRPQGVGYDSEASDREEDPAIEEQFVIRMIPGPDCDYLRDCVIGKKFGIPKSQGGADIYMRFFHENGRRGIIKIKDKIYATTLVDLPCIVEGMKSWDKRGWWKSADICQLLLVFAPVEREEEAKTINLPTGVDPVTFQYPHGLTAPMHYARKRVFRKRVSKTTIEAVEDEVERLLREDDLAEGSRFEMVDPERHESQFSPQGSDYGDDIYSGNEDAEGEDDDQDQTGYFDEHMNGGIEDTEHADALAAELEAEMMAEMGGDTPATDTPAVPGTPLIPEQNAEEQVEEYDSGDESAEDDDDDAASEVDIEAKNREKLEEGIREDIQDLERQLVDQQNKLAQQTNVLLKKRVEESIRKIKAELQLKKASINEEEEA